METQNKIKVMLLDRDLEFKNTLRASLEKEQNICIVAEADNGKMALELIKEHSPNVLIMDVLLGEYDGLWVLESMKSEGLSVEVCVIVSLIDSEMVVRKVMNLGVDYYMAKPVSVEILSNRVKQLYNSKQLMSNSSINNVTRLEPIMNIKICENSLEAEISAILSRMGVPASIKGYHYIRKAIMMAVENEEILIGITKGLYPDIAKHYKTTASKVERAIRHAIESSWKRSGQSIFMECSGYNSENKPTNGQFIATISEYFRLNTKNRNKPAS